jgi:hypothetical protein
VTPTRLILMGCALCTELASTARAQHPTSAERTAVIALSAAYTGSVLWGAHLAIRDSLPEAPFGMHSKRSVREEFFFGTGTALSPSLPMLVAQAAVTALATGPRRTARRASGALAIAGALYAIGQLAEPVVYSEFHRPRVSHTSRLAVIAGNVVLPSLMTIAGIGARR